MTDQHEGEMHAAGLGRLIGRLKDLVSLIGTIGNIGSGANLDKLSPLWKAIQKFMTIQSPVDIPEGVKERVRAGLEVLKAFADFTATETDDEAAAFIDKILTNETLLNIVANLVSRFLAQAASVSVMDVNTIEALATPEEKVEFETAAIPWEAIFSIIRLIISLIGEREASRA
jgi:hypothetical protein